MKLNSIILLYKIIVLNSHYKYSRCVPSCPLNTEDVMGVPPCVANIAFPLTITTFKIPKFNGLMSEWYKACGHISCHTCKYYGTSNSHCGVQEGIKKLINQ